MKKVIIVSVLAMAAFFSACQSPETDVEKAKDKVEDAKVDLKTAQKEADSTIVKAADEKEWASFKTASEMNIKRSEEQIAALKEKMKKQGKAVALQYNKSIDSLEARNKELKMRLNSYSNHQTDWQVFKSEFNRDMEGLGQALKNFTATDKK